MIQKTKSLKWIHIRNNINEKVKDLGIQKPKSLIYLVKKLKLDKYNNQVFGSFIYFYFYN